MQSVPVAIVPHTHWDREWYLSFQESRARLVHLLDRLLDLLEGDESYARFLLDGQTAVVDDYAEIRPEALGRIRALTASGRLQMGPWMILMDEFMVSGETIIRNLRFGIERAHELGGLMAVGYLPDMFGHIAQMPQILRLAGLEHTVVWRGVPSAITQSAFWWESPDGSRVRAEYLCGSYSNGQDIPNDPGQLVARARGYESELGTARLPGGGLLLMNGTDHQLPQPWLGRVVGEANAIQDDYVFAVASLAEYLPAQPVDGLATWRGELRSGARANVLMGVASNRVDVHRACAAAERALERRAEPLSALFLAPERHPDALLRTGWRLLVLNSAHDSSCACSADEVVDAVTVRYQEARQIGDALTRDALHALATEIDVEAGSTLVMNPTRADRSGVVSVRVPGSGPVHFVADDGTPCPTQVLHTIEGEGFTAVVTGEKVRWVLDLMRGPYLAGIRITRVTGRQVGPQDWEYTFHAAGPGDDLLDLEATRAELLALGRQGATIRFRQHLAPARDVVFCAEAVPGFGWRTFRTVEGAGPSTVVRATDQSMANEHLEVRVDDDGTFTLRSADGVEVAGLDRLVDGGDGGDTYNYSPPADDEIIEDPAWVRVTMLEHGPVRARLLVERIYEIPAFAIGNAVACTRRSEEQVNLEVHTILELRACERFVRVRAEFDNRARDHRLRAHFPLPRAVEGSDAECAFAVVHRGLTAEGGPHENALPTFVSRRFVDCSDGDAGLALLHDGLLEYEVIDDGREIALTLTRAIGYLSRSGLALRPNPAGPLDVLEGPQLQRRLVLEYAVLPHRGDWRAANLYDAADEFLVPLERGRTGGVTGAHRPGSGRALRVEGAEVSAVTRDADHALVVRIFNPTPEPSRATVEHVGRPTRGTRVDLLGHILDNFDGPIELNPWEIVTIHLFGHSPGP